MSIYTCPMHPEVRQEQPGRCPKCGMALVLKGAEPTQPIAADRGLGSITWKSYLPLFLIFLFLAAVAVVFSWLDFRVGGFYYQNAIRYFMTGFFLVFAAFKFLDLKGFARGYFTYDILARKVFVYGYIYPFIELGFGLAMLMGIQSPTLLWAEVAVMAFSGIGVAIKLLKREKFQCVCLGTFLKVPLTYVTLIEDFGMAALAMVLLLAK